MTGKELLYTIYQKLENYTTNLNDTYNDLVENDLDYELEISAHEIINEKQNVLELMYQFSNLEKELEYLTRYKRAFEILKEILSMHKDTSLNGEVDFYTLYFTGELPYECYKHLIKEEYELLEELMNDE